MGQRQARCLVCSLPGSGAFDADGSLTLMEAFVWLRVPGDVVFSIGVLFLTLFAVRLLRGGKRVQLAPRGAGVAQASKP